MELNGALLNRDIQENMALSADLAGHLGKLPNAEPRKRPALARRSGLVRSAVFQVLAASEHPLRAREIQAAAETFAGEPLSVSLGLPQPRLSRPLPRAIAED